jgi:hypothetical protein
MTTIARLSRLAQPLYPSTGYHTWQHALEVFDRTRLIGNRLQKLGIPYNRKATDYAALLHDILYGLPAPMYLVPLATGFRSATSKEEVATVVARYLLEKLHVDGRTIDISCSAIMGTHPDTPLTHIEQMVVAAADLNIVVPFTVFRAQSETLRKEAAQLSGVGQILPTEFYRGSINYLGRYLMRRIQLTEEYFTSGGQSAFHLGALANIVQLARRTWKNGRVVGEVAVGKTPLILSEQYRLADDDLFIRVDLNPRDPLLPTFHHLQADYKARGLMAPMTVFIPREERALSIPDRALDRLYLNNCWLRTLERQNIFPLTELVRTLRPGGDLSVVETYQSEGSMLDRRRWPTLQRELIHRFEGLGFTNPRSTNHHNSWTMTFSYQ